MKIAAGFGFERRLWKSGINAVAGIDEVGRGSWARENQMPIKKGDRVCASIAAASIVAKVYRDSLMKQLDRRHPGYGLAIHKGYGTKMHQKALSNLSLSSIHRKSFNLKPFLSAG